MAHGSADVDVLEHPGFHIDSEAAANTLLRRHRALAAQKVVETADARKKVEAILTRSNAIINAIDSAVEVLEVRYDEELRLWSKAELASGDLKTLKLIEGICAFRDVPRSVSVIDVDAAIAYAQEHRLKLVDKVVTLKLDKAGYKKLAEAQFAKSAAWFPGIEVKAKYEKFSYTLTV